MSTVEELAKKMHEAYERLAPDFGWETQKKSQKPWEEVPEENRKLMVAVIKEVFTAEAIKAVTKEAQETEGARRAVARATQTRANELRGVLTNPGSNPGKRLLDLVGEWDKQALMG